jgi:hypothetical protein
VVLLLCAFGCLKTSVNSTLPSIAAAFKWQQVQAIALFSYFYLFFGVYE